MITWDTEKARAPLSIGFRRLFASGQIPIGKIFGGYLQVATLKSFCIVLFAQLLRIHPLKLIEIPTNESRRGSVLMEFVLVLPVYIAVMGGVLWIGMKSLDAINLRSADHWSVWSEGNRFQMRTPAMLGLRDMFPRSTLVTTNAARRLEAEHSYLQFIASKTTLMQTRPDYISNWIDMPYTMSGESKPVWDQIPEFMMTSSRYGNKYTQCIIMRTKASRTAKRHWHSSLLADPDRNIWEFGGNEDKYPGKWELKLMDNAKYKDDTKEVEKEPKKIDFYERYEKYKEWSEPAK